MYKVFIDNVPIYFQKAIKNETNIDEHYLPHLLPAKFASFKEEIAQTSLFTRLYFSSPHPFEELTRFFSKFKWIEAAGGIVQHPKREESLFILRHNKWDIPKGKIEKNESPEIAAIREIQEECGLQKMSIKEALSPTFHVYFAYGHHWIKKTHWFLLSTEEYITHPQQEEGITKAKWFTKNDLSLVKENTYGSICDVITAL